MISFLFIYLIIEEYSLADVVINILEATGGKHLLLSVCFSFTLPGGKTFFQRKTGGFCQSRCGKHLWQPGASLPLSQALLAPAGRSGGLWAPGTAVHGHPQPNPALSSGSGSKGPKHSGRQTIRGGLLAEILQSCTLARERERPLL